MSTRVYVQLLTVAYVGGIKQWAADCHEAIIYHGSQKEALSWPKENNWTKLNGTSKIGDGISLHQETGKHIGCNRRWIAYVSKGQVAQKKIHRMMELKRDSDKNDCAEIATYGHQVDTKDDREEDDSKNRIIC